MLIQKPSGKKWRQYQKQWQSSDLHETIQIIHHSKGFDTSYPKMYFLLNLGHCVKSYGYLCQILSSFTMTTHQIWSYHMSQAVNFDNFKVLPYSSLNSTLYVWRYLVPTPSTKRGGGGGVGSVHPPPFDLENARLYNFNFCRPLGLSMRGRKPVELMI